MSDDQNSWLAGLGVDVSSIVDTVTGSRQGEANATTAGQGSAAPTISAVSNGDGSFTITGSGFLTSTKVTVRLVDDALHTFWLQISSDGQGKISVTPRASARGRGESISPRSTAGAARPKRPATSGAIPRLRFVRDINRRTMTTTILPIRRTIRPIPRTHPTRVIPATRTRRPQVTQRIPIHLPRAILPTHRLPAIRLRPIRRPMARIPATETDRETNH
jgi:hypothetical protein